MNFNLASSPSQQKNALIAFIFSNTQEQPSAHLLNKDIVNLINDEKIQTKANKLQVSYVDGQPLYLIGAGDQDKLDENAFFALVKTALNAVKDRECQIDIAIEALVPKNRDLDWTVRHFTQAWLSGLYAYDTTKSEKSPVSSLEAVSFICPPCNLQSIEVGKAIAHGSNVAKELGNLPGNVCTPTYLAEQAINLADAKNNVSVEVLEEEQLIELGMGSMMSVAKGSDEPAKFIILNYQGSAKSEAPYVLVGKGLTFDSGGISLKPGARMEEMKYDMMGAGSVFGAFSAICEIQPELNVMCVIASAENMPSARATKPGDVVTSMSGKTIEVINTDAEGRLVLCDALTYVERFKPKAVIDVATLTGACVVALGHHAQAIYANDDQLSQDLLTAGLNTWDRGWPMPLWDDWKKEVETPYADLRNTGNVAGAGGSITAAIFLEAFTREYPWAHMDIAGTAWSSAKEGATGRPVPLLTEFLLSKVS